MWAGTTHRGPVFLSGFYGTRPADSDAARRLGVASGIDLRHSRPIFRPHPSEFQSVQVIMFMARHYRDHLDKFKKITPGAPTRAIPESVVIVYRSTFAIITAVLVCWSFAKRTSGIVNSIWNPDGDSDADRTCRAPATWTRRPGPLQRTTAAQSGCPGCPASIPPRTGGPGSSCPGP